MTETPRIPPGYPDRVESLRVIDTKQQRPEETKCPGCGAWVWEVCLERDEKNPNCIVFRARKMREDRNG